MSTQLAIPGDIVFAHSSGIIGRAIRLGERLRFRSGATWNHVAIVDRIEGGKVYIIQAEASGVTNDKELHTVSPNGHYIVLEPPQGVDVEQLLEFARAQVGSRYGFGTILAIAVDILTPGWFPSLRPANKKSNSWICSAVVGESLRFGGWLHHFADIYLVTPAELWSALYE